MERRSRRKKWTSPGPGAYNVDDSKVRKLAILLVKPLRSRAAAPFSGFAVVTRELQQRSHLLSRHPLALRHQGRNRSTLRRLYGCTAGCPRGGRSHAASCLRT